MKKTALLFVIVLLLAGLLAACAQGSSADQESAGSLAVQEAWARPAKSGANSAIYFTINNTGDDDAMTGVSCDAAMMAEMHKTTTDANNNSMMVKQDSVPLPGGEKTSFAPGGLHIMLMKLKSDLQPGQKITATLRFEKAGEVTVEATVREP